MDNQKVYAMKFAKVYPLLINKAERKGRTKEEVDEIIFWLTGYDDAGLAKVLEEEKSYREFFKEAPSMNEKRELITGVVCGIRVENIEEDLMREVRYLDKLIDELATLQAESGTGSRMAQYRRLISAGCGGMALTEVDDSLTTLLEVSTIVSF